MGRWLEKVETGLVSHPLQSTSGGLRGDVAPFSRSRRRAFDGYRLAWLDRRTLHTRAGR